MKHFAPLTLSVCCWAASAVAGDPQKADAAFTAGKAAMEKADYTVACQKFGESQRADPAPGTLRALAECEERRGKLVSSTGHLKEALALRPAKDMRTLIDAQLAAVNARIAHIAVPSGPDVTVAVDGEDVTDAGADISVDPGRHTVELRGGAGRTSRREVELAPGERLALAFEAEPREAARTVGPAPKKRAPEGHARGGEDDAWGYVLTGLGAVGVTVAVITGLKLASTKAACANHSCSQDDASGAKKTLPIYYASVAVGVVGLGAGGYLLLTSSPPSESIRGVTVALGGAF